MYKNIIPYAIDAINNKNKINHLVINFINNDFSDDQIINMMNYGFHNFKDKNDQFVNFMKPYNVEHIDNSVIKEYTNKQTEVNMVLLQMLYKVAYEHDGSDIEKIRRTLRTVSNNTNDPITKMVKINRFSVFSAMRIMHNVFSSYDYAYLKTLPPFAIYDVFFHPRSHKNPNYLKRVPGYESTKPEFSVANSITERFIYCALETFNGKNQNNIEQEVVQQQPERKTFLNFFTKTR